MILDLLLKGVHVLSPRGILFEEKGIQTALDLRYLNAKERKKGVYGKDQNPINLKIEKVLCCN